MKINIVYIMMLMASIVLFDCSKNDSTRPLAEFDIDSLPVRKLEPVDSSFLSRYILANDKITEWSFIEKVNIQLEVKKSKTEYLEDIRKLYQFYKYSSTACNGFRHELVLRTMNSEIDKIPDQTLLLLTIDKQGKLLSTVTLAAKSSKQLITQFDKETTSVLHQDSTLTTVRYSDFCSDVLDEQGKIHCTKVKITNSYKVHCDLVNLMTTDTVRTEY